MRTESPRSPCSTPESQYPERTGNGSSRWNFSLRYLRTSSLRSSPARASAGSPGRSCCSPKIRIETKNSVGTIRARRCSRYFSIASLRHPQPLQPHHSVGHRAQAGELGAVAPQPMAVEDVTDRAVAVHLLGDLLVELDALRRVEGAARLVDELVDLRVAVARIVERRLAGEVDLQVAVGIGAAAPGEDVGLELALVGEGQ